MTIRERIDGDYVAAVKSKDAAAVSTLRLLRAALKNAQIEKLKPLEEADVIDVASREIKKLKDGLESYVAGQREDLASQARAEIELVGRYLPAALGDDELGQLIKNKIAELGATSEKDFGRVMGAVSKETKGRADGAKVSALVKAALAGGGG